jgi:hypothetical protein
MRVWLRDDSPDLARTMAALDARLPSDRRMVPACAHDAERGASPSPLKLLHRKN